MPASLSWRFTWESIPKKLSRSKQYAPLATLLLKVFFQSKKHSIDLGFLDDNEDLIHISGGVEVIHELMRSKTESCQDAGLVSNGC